MAVMYPVTVALEWMILYNSVTSGLSASASRIPTIMIGDITYSYLTEFTLTAYVLIGLAVYANKDADPNMPTAVKFFAKAKEQMLFVSILNCLSIIAVAIFHYFRDGVSMAIFVVCELIFTIALIALINIQGNSIIASEIKKRLEKSASIDIKENQKEDEENTVL